MKSKNAKLGLARKAVKKKVTSKKVTGKVTSKAVKSKSKAKFGNPKKVPMKPRIAKLAEQYGSVTKLAAILGVSQSRLSQIIHKDIPMPEAMMEKIVEITEGKITLRALKGMCKSSPKKAGRKPAAKPKAPRKAKKVFDGGTEVIDYGYDDETQN